jgi:hypothetical protein
MILGAKIDYTFNHLKGKIHPYGFFLLQKKTPMHGCV